MRAQLVLCLVLATAAVQAIAAPEIRSSNTIANADGSGLELRMHFQAPTRAGQTLNKAVIEVELVPPEPIRPGELQPPEPVRYRIEGRVVTGPGEIDPCWMPAMLLLVKGYVSARQVSDALGLNGEITRVEGDAASAQDRGADARILGLMLAEVAALRPDRAPLVARLIADAGFPSGAVCLPAPRQ